MRTPNRLKEQALQKFLPIYSNTYLGYNAENQNGPFPLVIDSIWRKVGN